MVKDYLHWLNLEACQSSLLNHLVNQQYGFNLAISLRELLDIGVPLERFLSLSLKDHQVIRVKEGDRTEGVRTTHPIVFVLDHLRSAFNVGSLFRTAECLGVEHIYLVGYTPTPSDKGVQKTAMGTDAVVSWSQHNHFAEVADRLQSKQMSMVGLETCEEAVSLMEYQAPQSLALVVGNERFGISPQAQEQVSQFIEIPMQGMKNSLNVANALNIVTFEVIRQWNQLS